MKNGSSQNIPTHKPFWYMGGYFFKQILGAIKWMQRPDITIAVDWDANTQLTNCPILKVETLK